MSCRASSGSMWPSSRRIEMPVDTNSDKLPSARHSGAVPDVPQIARHAVEDLIAPDLCLRHPDVLEQLGIFAQRLDAEVALGDLQGHLAAVVEEELHQRVLGRGIGATV